MKRGIWHVVIAIMVVFAATASIASGWEGRVVPDFNVTDLDGKTYEASALKGKVIWINFWGLRCGPCVRELPALQKIYETYEKDGLIIIGVNADGVDAGFIQKSFSEREDLKKTGVTFPLVPDTDFALIDAFELMGAPLNIIVDREGIIRFYHEGYEAGDEAHYEDVVKELLAQ